MNARECRFCDDSNCSSHAWTNAMLQKKWYPVVNDVVGGWAVAITNRPMSEQPMSDVVLETLTFEMAKHIAGLHNKQNEWLLPLSWA